MPRTLVTTPEGLRGAPRTPETAVYQTDEDEITPTLEDWMETMKLAAAECLEELPLDMRKDYKKKDTWEKIKRRNEE